MVGFVAYGLIDLFHHPKPVGRIQAIVVARTERRRGIGTALLHAAEARLRALGCDIIEAATDIRIAGSQGFFRENGYGKCYRLVKGK